MSASAEEALKAALKENAKLKKRLAKLQRIESGLDAKDDKEYRKRERQTQREVCKKAFDDFDLDKSGFIDLHELSLLATELNAPMNATQLEEALKAIDLSGDGKISFDEFFKYWNSGAALAATGDKNPVSLALLRARLVSHKGKRVLDQMAAEAKKSGVAKSSAAASSGSGTAAAGTATASATTSGGTAAGKDSKDSKDAKTASPFDLAVPAGARVNAYTVSAGDFESGPAKGKLQVSLATGLNPDASALESDPKYGAFASMDIRSAGKPDFVPYLQAIAKSFSRSLAEYATFSVTQPSKDVARVTVGAAVPFPDPSELLQSLGIDAAALARVFALRLEFAHSLADFLDPKQALTPLDAIALRTDLRVVLESSLVKSLTNALAVAPSREIQKLQLVMPYLNSYDSKVVLRFGALKPLLDDVIASAGGAPIKGLPKELAVHMRKPVTDLIADVLKKENERAARFGKEIRQAASAVKMLALTLNRDFAEIQGVTGWTRAGLGVQLTLDGLLNVPHILAAVNWFEGVVNGLPVHNAPQVGRRR